MKNPAPAGNTAAGASGNADCAETKSAAVSAAPSAQEADAQAALRHAIALYRRGQLAEADAILVRLAKTAAGDANVWNARGVNLRAMKRLREAVWCYREALARDADKPGVWSNLGNALKDLKQVETAVACHRRAIALKPDDAGSHHNLGLALTAAGRHTDALAALDRALALTPDDARLRWDRARTRLYLGELARGWSDYEARLATGQLPERAAPGRRWHGERYDGKRLLIISEQGFGDAIWIARYLERVKALGGELVMECRPELIPLVAAMGVADRLVPKSDPLPDADLHLYQCSLPGFYTPDLASVSGEPYLKAEPKRAEKFADAIARGAGKLRVGVVWCGSMTFGANHERAVSLRLFLQSFAMPGVQLYSLQKGPPRAELEAMAASAPILDLAPLLGDFGDTAAAVAALDLVIMTDSAVAHLGGAMGKPVWVLLSLVPHWLWLADRDDSPWYRSVRLFRQRAWGDWTGVFDRAAAALMAYGCRR
ncbi:MAG TPA: tetratricopeptide repeat protein [Xanthobacteraceae bacterium]|nr:tetratricopeptide repeat protein [Xanthobacteraceae bacterium]